MPYELCHQGRDQIAEPFQVACLPFHKLFQPADALLIHVADYSFEKILLTTLLRAVHSSSL